MFTKLNIMIIKPNVMFLAFSVKWLVMFLENDIMFSKPDVMLFLLFRILLPRLEFYSVAVPSCKFLKRRITKMAPQGATAKHFATRISSSIYVLTSLRRHLFT